MKNIPSQNDSPWKAEEKVSEIVEKICYCELLGGDRCEECSVGKILMKAEEHMTLLEKKQAPKRCQRD